MSSVLDANGKEQTQAKDIADVFATFFESLYDGDGKEFHNHGGYDNAIAVSPEEVRSQLKKMRGGKAADENGVVAELLSKGSDLLMTTIADVFTAVLNPQATIPEYWKSSSIRVLFKKGDDRLPANYRPICIIPILYKLFSRVLCGRIKDILIAEQSYDQAGFRPGFSCDDHLFAITILAEKCNEFNVPLWIATLDFKKAFDSISHASIWESLVAHGVPSIYVKTLSRLYSGQRAHVCCDVASRAFNISRGTKQGDPISPFIFNSVLEEVMRKVKAKWTTKGYGRQLGYSDYTVLTNLRFADDILLVGRSLPQIKRMIEDVQREGAKVGLELHPEKTKIQHNNIGYGSKVRTAMVGSMQIEVMEPHTSNMYLGRALTLTNVHDAELSYRLKKAWAKFGAFKQELTDKSIPTNLRMKLFHSVVTPTALYGCGSWVMTAERDSRLKSTQFKMVRAILGRRRIVQPGGDIESWVEWVQRVTDEARRMMEQFNIPGWIDERRSRLQRWNERLGNMSLERWARRAQNWIPDGHRSRGRPPARWADQLTLSP